MKKLIYLLFTILITGNAMGSPAQPSNPSTLVGKILSLELQTRKTNPNESAPTNPNDKEPVAPLISTMRVWSASLEIIDCKTFDRESNKEIAPAYKKAEKIKLFMTFDKEIAVGDIISGRTPSTSSYLPLFSVSDIKKTKRNEINLEYREFTPTKKEQETLLKIIKENKLHGTHLRTLVSKKDNDYIIYVGSENPYQGGSGQEYTFYSKTQKLILNYTEELAPAPDIFEEPQEE